MEDVCIPCELFYPYLFPSFEDLVRIRIVSSDKEFDKITNAILKLLDTCSSEIGDITTLIRKDRFQNDVEYIKRARKDKLRKDMAHRKQFYS